ncbi:hypothetical protein ACFQ0I_02765 [Mariniflexile aquimaris]|uniref:SprT-like family protein n=1 Tax=Mariniflexile aquimaris TaxID=881009 RepID=A0ABW3BQE5_9FLAO
MASKTTNTTTCADVTGVIGVNPNEACGDGYVFDYELNTCVVDDKIINNLTNPCANSIFTQLDTEMLKKDILNKVMNTPNGVQLTFAESILKLFNDSDTFNFTIQNNNTLDEGKNASTTGGYTTLSDSYLRGATQLSIARTIIHEMVHAYLNVKYSNFIALNDWSFKDAMDKYAKDNGITDINSNEFHHDYMGQYVDAMAISLANWDGQYGTGGIYVKDSNGNNLLDSNKEPMFDWEYYRSMAFAGLNYKDSNGNLVETESFKTLVPNQSDRDKIKNIVINEQDGKSNAKGTKCN